MPASIHLGLLACQVLSLVGLSGTSSHSLFALNKFTHAYTHRRICLRKLSREFLRPKIYVPKARIKDCFSFNHNKDYRLILKLYFFYKIKNHVTKIVKLLPNVLIITLVCDI